jgi:putative membrane protein
MARAAAGKGASRLARLALGASWLLVWDLALDPAMSYLTPYWRWEDSGPYYGMPWVNLGGWFVTGLALMATLDLLSERGDWASVPVRWMASYYAVVLALPLGMVVAGGLWIAALATVSSLGLVAALSIAVRRRPAVQELTVRAVEPNPVGVR